MATQTEKIVYGGELMLFISDLPIAFSTNAKLEITLDAREISSKDGGYWKARQAGRYDWKASTDALYTEPLTGTATTTTFDELFTLMVARTKIPLTFARTSGAAPAQIPDELKNKWSGYAIIVGLTANAPDNETATYTISLEGTGALLQT